MSVMQPMLEEKLQLLEQFTWSSPVMTSLSRKASPKQTRLKELGDLASPQKRPQKALTNPTTAGPRRNT